MTDYKDWVRRAQSADRSQRNFAFDHLARDFQGMVYSVAYSKLSDRELAEDVAQEAFLAAYKQINQLQDVAAFPSWLKRIVMTQADRITRRKQLPIQAIETTERLASDEASPEALLEASELQQRVRSAVATLPEKERKVTRDFYFMGESQREISEKLNLPLVTVKKRLQYAREHLRGLISGFNETIDRAIQGDQEPQKQYQPVYIYQRKRRRGPGDDLR